MKAWAICDTDGGRQQPKPLLRHIYPTKEIAVEAAKYRDFDPTYYPVIEVTVEIGGEQ